MLLSDKVAGSSEWPCSAVSPILETRNFQVASSVAPNGDAIVQEQLANISGVKDYIKSEDLLSKE